MNQTQTMNRLTRITTILTFLLTVVWSGWSAESGNDKPLLHPLFCDHLVLQRDKPVPVWGWSQPGAKVTVSFAGQKKTATVGPDGKWMIKLKAMPASAEPRTLSVSNAATHEVATATDVLVGDVWLCSGQSNMEMGIGLCNAPHDIATANFPQLRLLTVPHRIANTPVADLSCRWLPCSPDTILQGAWGGFSASAFFFGRDLQQQLNIPIGLIHSSWGGTIAEAWTSAEGLEPVGDFNDVVKRFHDSGNEQGKVDYTQAYQKWCEEKDPGTREGWEKTENVEASWKSVQMPQPFEQAGLPDFDGMVWFQRTFDLPAAWAGRDLKLELGSIDDFDTTWINGVRVGGMHRYDLLRSYAIAANLLKPGRNVVTVRVLDTGGTGGFTGQADQLRITLVGEQTTASISLAGIWRMRDSAPMSQLSSPPSPPDANNPNVATALYNGMIAPLLPFAIKGAIWYQGESNADRAWQYRRLLPAMITDWRRRFGVGAFPFYLVQLAAFQAAAPEPRENNWAELREAQAMTAKTLRNCGLAVAIDIGDAVDIHPKDKQDVGHRLALNALAQTYGKKVEFSGPWYRSMKIDGDKVHLKFDHTDGGLVAKGGRLTGFAVAGADHKFVWAEAVIAGDTVVVTSPKVAQPVAVRYAWDINPACNLFNQSGLPAVPFRTDNWPAITSKSK